MILERINILERICVRGLKLMQERLDSNGVDLFEHLLSELNYLKQDLEKENGIF